MIIKLEQLLEEEKTQISKLKKELTSYRCGRLVIRRRDEAIFFCEMKNGIEKGITKNPTRLFEISRKEYIESQLQFFKSNQTVLEKAIRLLKKCPLPRGFEKLNIPQLHDAKYTPEQIRWLQNSTESNPYKPEHLKYVTNSGIYVRSKSERIIADKLDEFGILYKYEVKMTFNNQVFYPDFIIMKENGEIVLWEHFGLTDNQQYLIKAFEKIRIYNKNNFKQHSNLICTYEDDLENPIKIDEIIIRFLL